MFLDPPLCVHRDKHFFVYYIIQCVFFQSLDIFSIKLQFENNKK